MNRIRKNGKAKVKDEEGHMKLRRTRSRHDIRERAENLASGINENKSLYLNTKVKDDGNKRCQR